MEFKVGDMVQCNTMCADENNIGAIAEVVYQKDSAYKVRFKDHPITSNIGKAVFFQEYKLSPYMPTNRSALSLLLKR